MLFDLNLFILCIGIESRIYTYIYNANDRVCTIVGGAHLLNDIEVLERERENVLEIHKPMRKKTQKQHSVFAKHIFRASIWVWVDGGSGGGGTVLCFQLMCVVERNAIIFYN